MASRTSPKLQTMPDGLELALNDHVFVAAPYDDRGGDPYNIGRVQEFLPGSQQVRVNFYIRPRDIGTRMAQHGRRLLCTMHSDLVPAHFVRGKCTVIHRDNIPNQDEEKYRMQPDCFYFNQYYDRYLHRYFDVVPIERVRNAPEHVLRFLVEHFTYILCESSYVSDLCDELDSCELCRKPAAYADSVSCEVCSKHFHMRCLNPPLAGKPKKGFGFTCAPCYQRQEEEYEEYLKGKRATPPPAAKSSKAKGKAKVTASMPAAESGGMRLMNGWPWRYYGVYTLPEDVLDPHESLYPRAASRLGPKYQTVVPEDRTAPIPSTSRFKNPPIARGEDSEVDTIFKPTPSADDPELDEYMETVKKMPLYQAAGVSLLNQALLRWQADPSAARASVQKLTKREFRITNWSSLDIANLDEGLEDVGDDIAELHRFVPNKTLHELVNYVYIKRPAINNRVDTKHDEDKFAGAVVTGILTSRDADEVAEADLETESRASTPPPRSKKKLGPCSLCETKESPAWFRCPGQTGTLWSAKEKTLCEDCSVQWRHYANDHLIVEDSRNKNRNGRARAKTVEATPADVAALSSMLSPQSSLTPEPPDPPKPVLQPKPCVLCKRNDPKTTLAQCQRCSVCCHTLCAALDPATVLDEWLCELCTEACRPKAGPTVMASTETPAQFRARETPLPIDLTCALCPDTFKQSGTPANNSPLSALDLYRKTEFNNLVHYICAVWHPEVKFPDPSRPIIAEGACNISMERRLQECTFCQKKAVGAFVQCADCDVWFHVGCAWAANCRFGFEMVAAPPPRKKDKEGPAIVDFKDSTGLLVPSIWCKSHKLDETRRSDRSTFELGEKDHELQLTTIMAYLKSYKAAQPSSDAALLLKANKLDSWIWPALSQGSSEDPMAAKHTRSTKKHIPQASSSQQTSKKQASSTMAASGGTTKSGRRTATSKRASLAADPAAIQEIQKTGKRKSTRGRKATRNSMVSPPAEPRPIPVEEGVHDTPKLTIKLHKATPSSSATATRPLLPEDVFGDTTASELESDADGTRRPAKRHKPNGSSATRSLSQTSQASTATTAEPDHAPLQVAPDPPAPLEAEINGSGDRQITIANGHGSS